MLSSQPDTHAPDSGPSERVIRELHRDLVRQERHKFLAASPLLLLAAAALIAGALFTITRLVNLF